MAQIEGEADAKPVHTLRKSIVSLMANKFGIHVAQRLLRDPSQTITSKFYTDREASVLPGIGAPLRSQGGEGVVRYSEIINA